MREDIKERIEMIKRGEVPKGYKYIDENIIPTEWEMVKMGDICKMSSGMTPSRKNTNNFDGNILWVTSGELKNKYISDTLEKISENVLKSNNLKIYDKGTFIIALYGLEAEGIRGTGSIVRKECTISQACMAFTDFKNVLNEYMYYWYEKHGEMIGLKYAQGTKQQNLNAELISNLFIILPSIREQEQIVQILQCYDVQIDNLKQLIEQKRNQKICIMQNLISAKKRLSGYKNDWKKIKIKKIIKELNEKTTQNNQYEILSVTKDGIFKQSEHFNKQIASEDNCGYKVIRRNNLVFSTMNLWMGSLDVLKKYDVGIVSPAYKIFEFDKQYMIPEFGEYFMKSDYMIWIYGMNSEQGASVVRRNLDMDGLLNTFVNIPEIEEQKAIAQILSQADKEIELLEQQLEQIKLEKKAMMQLLLTGIVRVNQKGGE